MFRLGGRDSSLQLLPPPAAGRASNGLDLLYALSGILARPFTQASGVSPCSWDLAGRQGAGLANNVAECVGERGGEALGVRTGKGPGRAPSRQA